MILIGSKALDFFDVNYPTRGISAIQDTDFLSSFSQYEDYLSANKSKIILVKEKDNGNMFYKTVFQKGSYPVEFKVDENLIEILENNGLIANSMGVKIAYPEVILTLKLSHRYLKNSPHFLKTLKDIDYLRRAGYKVPECLRSWLKEEEKRVLSYQHPNLNRSKEQFFVDKYPYDHDSIHISMAIHDKPAYEYYKVSDKEVLCSKEKFFAVDEEIRLAGVLEEALVLALERHQIPNNFEPDSKKSFLMALEKVCTSITSGWFREFAYDNYFKVLGLFYEQRSGYVEKFQIDLDKGIIKILNYART